MKHTVKKETIAWECPTCGTQHSWLWEEGEASPGRVGMFCDVCGQTHKTEMVQIGARTWTALYDPQEMPW